MKTDTLDKLVWTLVYAGIILGGFGLSLVAGSAAIGWALTGVGAALFTVGAALIVVRARINGK